MKGGFKQRRALIGGVIVGAMVSSSFWILHNTHSTEPKASAKSP